MPQFVGNGVGWPPRRDRRGWARPNRLPGGQSEGIQSTQDDWINTQAETMEDVQAFLAEAEGEEP
ncbi:hypothetical protein ACFYR1_19850 [Streptomyces canus]|uniref:hypothetical protein n=1 Tax=Streptomyces canus TaxID=58343 RepID=UPI00369B47DA